MTRPADSHPDRAYGDQAAGTVTVMEDFGGMVSYLALAVGTPIYDVDSASVGVVEHVLADEGADIFQGVTSAPANLDL